MTKNIGSPAGVSRQRRRSRRRNSVNVFSKTHSGNRAPPSSTPFPQGIYCAEAGHRILAGARILSAWPCLQRSRTLKDPSGADRSSPQLSTESSWLLTQYTASWQNTDPSCFASLGKMATAQPGSECCPSRDDPTILWCHTLRSRIVCFSRSSASRFLSAVQTSPVVAQAVMIAKSSGHSICCAWIENRVWEYAG